MATPRRPHVPAEQRREQLTETAHTVIRRDGAWALTTRAIAREAGVPHGSVHYVFSSKGDLLRALVDQDLSHLSDLLREVIRPDQSGPQDLAEMLVDLFGRYADAVIADPLTEAAYFEMDLLGVRDPDLTAEVARSHLEYRRLISDALTTLGDRAQGRWATSVDTVAEQVMTLLFGASLNWLTHRDDDLLREILTTSAHLVASLFIPDEGDS